MQRFMIVIVILTAVFWWWQPDVVQKSLQNIESKALEDYKNHITKAKRWKDTEAGPKIIEKQPYFKVTLLSDSSYFVIPADDNFYEIGMPEDQKFEISLHHSQNYDSMQMWGSNQEDFVPASIVFDWTQKELTHAEFDRSFFKAYQFFRIRWNNIVNKTSQKANFVFGQRSELPPGVKITYQAVGVGTKEIDLSYEIGDDGELKAPKRPILSVRKNSVFGIKFDFSRHKLISCEYRAPKSEPQDCQNWMTADHVASVTKDDEGLHTIQVMTDSGAFRFEIEMDPEL